MLWLSKVREVCQPLSAQSPIAARRHSILEGPVLRSPEQHPYYECGILLEGEVVQMWGNQQARRRPGDIFLAGAGVPHWAKGVIYPISSVSVYFVPSILMEMGPQGDGLQLLMRFSACGALDGCLFHPPTAVANTLCAEFTSIAEEYEDRRSGRELRLRAMLALILTEFDRWHETQPLATPIARQPQWERTQRGLHYLEKHYAEPVYSSKLAAHLGMSESSVRMMFRQTIGIPWGRYLQMYRIHQAVGLLGAGELNITQVAAAVGFDSLNHFEAVFRSLTGMSPKAFARSYRSAADAKPPKSDG